MATETFDVGDTAYCDFCGADWTGKPDTGGFLFGTKACGPCCAKQLETDAIGYGEQNLIRSRCPQNMPFAEWVLSLRCGDNTVRVLAGEDAERAMGLDN